MICIVCWLKNVKIIDDHCNILRAAKKAPFKPRSISLQTITGVILVSSISKCLLLKSASHSTSLILGISEFVRLPIKYKPPKQQWCEIKFPMAAEYIFSSKEITEVKILGAFSLTPYETINSAVGCFNCASESSGYFWL